MICSMQRSDPATVVIIGEEPTAGAVRKLPRRDMLFGESNQYRTSRTGCREQIDLIVLRLAAWMGCPIGGAEKQLPTGIP